MATENAGPNEEAIDVWNAIIYPKLLRFRHVFVEGASQHSAVAFARHPVSPGEHVLDVGCGFGETSIDLAKRVAPGGSVLAFDCVNGMLDIARADAKAAGAGNVEIVCGDAQTHTFGPATFDVLFARFGTMFFISPVAAMRNLKKALKPGGRLLMLVWRSLEDNEWAALPKRVARKHLPPPGEEARSCGPGPFSMSDRETVSEILRASGYVDVAFEQVDADILVGRTIPEAISFQLALGPAGEIVREAGALGEAKRAELEADLAKELERHTTADGVKLRSSSWCVTARVP